MKREKIYNFMLIQKIYNYCLCDKIPSNQSKAKHGCITISMVYFVTEVNKQPIQNKENTDTTIKCIEFEYMKGKSHEILTPIFHDASPSLPPIHLFSIFAENFTFAKTPLGIETTRC